jgi:hypothetical protein
MLSEKPRKGGIYGSSLMCMFCKALRHRDCAHLMFVTVASDNENGDENGGRFRESSTLSRRSEAKTEPEGAALVVLHIFSAISSHPEGIFSH